MTLASAAALQEAVQARLAGDAGLGALVGGAVFDAAPQGAVPDIYVQHGAEALRQRRDGGGAVVEHRLEIAAVGAAESFAAVKGAAAAAEAALTGTPLALAEGRLLELVLLRARARRGTAPARRKIEMIFRALVDQSAT